MVNLYKNNNKLVIIFGAISFSFVLILMALFIYQQQQQINLLNNKLTVNNQPLPTVSTVAEVSPTKKPNPTPTPKIYKAKILDTSVWTKHECGSISFKIPLSGYQVKCNQDSIDAFNVVITANGSFVPSANISITKFDGGSRRQYWITQIQASDSDVSKYMRFQETLFGTVSGLDVFASGGWWQSGYASPILIANGKTIVAIHGGRDLKDQSNYEIVRWDFTDSIASTVKFL